MIHFGIHRTGHKSHYVNNVYLHHNYLFYITSRYPLFNPIMNFWSNNLVKETQKTNLVLIKITTKSWVKKKGIIWDITKQSLKMITQRVIYQREKLPWGGFKACVKTRDIAVPFVISRVFLFFVIYKDTCFPGDTPKCDHVWNFPYVLLRKGHIFLNVSFWIQI